MDEYDSLSHSTWECKYHVVFIPKYRRKTLARFFRHLECSEDRRHLKNDGGKPGEPDEDRHSQPTERT
jgi:hypothetical protein